MTSIGLSRAGWRTSSCSGANSNCVEVLWRKSSFSTANSDCVEIGFAGEIVGARDSKNPGGPVLVFEPARWSVFLRDLSVG